MALPDRIVVDSKILTENRLCAAHAYRSSWWWNCPRRVGAMRRFWPAIRTSPRRTSGPVSPTRASFRVKHPHVFARPILPHEASPTAAGGVIYEPRQIVHCTSSP
jgi:hypothetical protein